MAEYNSVMQLINTALTFETSTFLQDLTVLAMLSPDYLAFLSRIMVNTLTIFKGPSPLYHEGLIVELIDTDDANSAPLLIFLERTASSYRRPSLKCFSNHPNSGTVLESIVHTLKDIPSALLASLPPGSDDTSSPPIPLRNFTHPSESSACYQPIADEPESDHKPDHKPERTKFPWFDATTLAGTKVLHTSSQSSSIHYHAEDRFIGAKNLVEYVLALHNLQQIKLEPNILLLVDFAILTNNVHDHNPLYTLLAHHCYWFVQIICAIVEMLYPCTMIHSKTYAHVSEDTICIPANDYLPDLAGRTMGILVCKIEAAVVSVVAGKFQASKEAKLNEVNFIINSE